MRFHVNQADLLLDLNSCTESAMADSGNIVHIQNSYNTPEIAHNADSDPDTVIQDGLGSDLRRSRRIKKISSYLADYQHQIANLHKDSNSNFKIKYPISSVLTYDFLSDKHLNFTLAISSHVEPHTTNNNILISICFLINFTPTVYL